MKKQRGDLELGGALVLTFLIVGVMLVGAAILDAKACHARWEHSGMRTSWGIMTDCLVQLPDGRWMPEKNLKEINLK